MKKLFLILLIAPIFLTSCVTTAVYEKNEFLMLEDAELISSESKLYKNGKLKKQKIENITSPQKNSENSNTSDKLNSSSQVSSNNAKTAQYKNSENICVQKTDEKVTVESKPNGKFIAYTFLGKPFVILGSTAWEFLKSCGYAFLNFSGGYNTFTGGDVYWKLPDVKGNIEKSKKYNAANKITVYPEYHIPFTDNKITVNKIIYEAKTITTNENEMIVTSKENFTVDNTLSVKKSASADAYATAGVVGAIGAVVTVPISIVTWVLGAAYGIYSK